MTIKARLFLSLGLLSLLLVAVTATGWVALGVSNQGMKTVFNDRVVPLRDLKIASDMYAVNVVDTAHKVRSGAVAWEEGIRLVDIALVEVHKRWSHYMTTYMDADEKQSADTAELRMKQAQWVFIVGIVLGITAIAFALMTTHGRVIRPLHAMAQMMERLAKGDLTIAVAGADRGDEVGILARSLTVFKDAALDNRRIEGERQVEQQRKEQRRRQIEGAIAAAIEEQSATTGEITRNVQEAARGTEDVTKTIVQVNAAASQTGDGASHVLGASSDLAQQAESLRREVESFLISIRAA